MLILTYLRISLNRRTHEERAFLAVWHPLLLSSLHSSVSAVLPRLPARHRVYFLKLWNQLMRSANSREATDNLISIAYSIGCDHFSRRLLRHGNRVECLLATITLGHLRDHASWDALVMQTLAADNVTSINAFQALVQIDAKTAAQQLTPLMLAREDWAISHIASILQPAHSAFMLPLLEAVEEIRATFDPCLAPDRSIAPHHAACNIAQTAGCIERYRNHHRRAAHSQRCELAATYSAAFEPSRLACARTNRQSIGTHR
jgi:hypothetical protein